MPKTPRKSRKSTKTPRSPRRPRKPKPLDTPFDNLPHVVSTVTGREVPFTPATLEDIRLAYDAVNRGAAQVSICRSPHAPSDNYVLHIHPVPEFGAAPTPPSPRPPTLEVPNHSNPKNIVFGPA